MEVRVFPLANDDDAVFNRFLPKFAAVDTLPTNYARFGSIGHSLLVGP